MLAHEISMDAIIPDWNNFKISERIIWFSTRDAHDVLRRRGRGTRTREAEDAEWERGRRERKTKRSKRICDLAMPWTRPRLPAADFSHLSGFSVVIRRCRWDRSRREERIVGDYGKPPVPVPEADQKCRLLRWRSDPREIITRPSRTVLFPSRRYTNLLGLDEAGLV